MFRKAVVLWNFKEQLPFGFRLIFIHPEVYNRSSVCLSIRLSVCPPSVDIILSTHVLRKGSIDLSENVFTCSLITHHLKMCTWNIHIDRRIFSSFFRVFSLLMDFVVYLYQEIVSQKL